MKKHIKTTIVIVVLVALGLGYYYYLANRTPATDATQMASINHELAALTTKDILSNYPQSPKELVKLYARITQAYYYSDTTDEQVKQLGQQARLLFDDELKEKQTEEEFLTALQEDVDSYRLADRYISEYKIEGSDNTRYTTFKGREYASINMVYYIRQKSALEYSYTRFIMRKDTQGNWKILYWELIPKEDIDE